MARQLWLLRHGEAEPHDAGRDDERSLTERGEAQARSAGRALAALELTFQAAYTSPKVRARDTARLACEALGIAPLDHEPLREGFSADDALELLHADERILVVGHDPDFTQVVHDLTGGRVDFKKGGVAGIRFDGARGELVALLRPRELDRIG
ncbi:MAG: phosphohistidine phosphatase [Solirubrobacteraceae bacterium]|jgi:phosphohistidine phosphatase|nr:phosphohistidine phosphatase [Solirubrobacteraceae bacterium]